MFYNEVMSFNETEVTATCCQLDGTPISVTCGQGLSCAASCFSLQASLCPSRDCNACDNFEEAQQVGRRQQSLATKGSSDWAWCSAGGNNCKVNPDKGGNKGCCFNPTCQSTRPVKCQWLQSAVGRLDFNYGEKLSRRASLLFFYDAMIFVDVSYFKTENSLIEKYII